ncbi:MAG: F0F1 ATP synthase subunit B [Gammaproteobacteria bacterium]|nr:F0F1 ATP synthase subunit B [Gammaproteobacteria bacterium]
MNINLTLIGQSIAFGIFVWFCLKFIWPPIIKALEERRTRIADGLAAADEGLRAKEKAEEEIEERLKEVREQAKDIIANAKKQAEGVVEEARNDARAEGERILKSARAEIDQQIHQAREELRKEVVRIALSGAEQVLMREVDSKAHSETLEKLSAGL